MRIRHAHVESILPKLPDQSRGRLAPFDRPIFLLIDGVRDASHFQVTATTAITAAVAITA